MNVLCQGNRGRARVVSFQTARREDFIILIFDRQDRAPASANDRDRFIFRWQPKISYLQIGMVDVGLLDPEGRILGRFRFDAADSEILAIHPDPSTIEELIRNLRLN